MKILNLLRDWRIVILLARDVYRSALKEKMMYGFLLLALLFILMANVPFMVDDPRVFGGEPPATAAVQIGFVSINIFTLLIAIFISVSTLQNFLAQERLVLLLAKPIRRWQIIEGVILGLFEMIFMNWCLMTAGIWLVIISQTKTLGFYVWQGMSVTVLMALLYVSLVVFFYCLVPNIMAGVLTVFMIIAGFGVSLAQDLFTHASYPFIIRKLLLLSLNILPKINALWGVSMQQLGLFNLKVNALPIILHAVCLIIALNAVSRWNFRRFGRT